MIIFECVSACTGRLAGLRSVASSCDFGISHQSFVVGTRRAIGRLNGTLRSDLKKILEIKCLRFCTHTCTYVFALYTCVAKTRGVYRGGEENGRFQHLRKIRLIFQRTPGACGEGDAFIKAGGIDCSLWRK